MNYKIQTNYTPNLRKMEFLMYIFAAWSSKDFGFNSIYIYPKI